MHKNQGPVYYGEYLNLPQFLGTQAPLSKKWGSECHDEMLFIVVHQAFELWFKQMLHELRSINSVFAKAYVSEGDLFSVHQRLHRFIKIQGLFLPQLEILETMTPMDFLEFRDLLMPASGFQSVQFREIEIRLGLSTESRASVDRNYFLGRLSESDRQMLVDAEKEKPLVDLLGNWLERLPFTQLQGFDFWSEYQKSVHAMLDSDQAWIEKNTSRLSEMERKAQLENLQNVKTTFATLFDANLFEQARMAKTFRLSQKAVLNALFIMLYRDEPMLSHPFEVLNSLITMDENFTSWRFKHSLMAQRMIGTKIGTGGSSGHQYLKRATETNRVFVDLFNLATFLIPRSQLPVLPEAVRKQLNF